MDTELDQRVVLVTGSSSGIGRATAQAFGAEGARVAITYHTNREGAEQTAELVEEAGGEPFITQYDLADDDAIMHAIQSVTDHWGTIHVLVNNAVHWGETLPSEAPLFEEVSPDLWQTMLRTNLEGVYKTVQAVLPTMRSGEWGRIVAISSNLAEDGNSGSGPYATAKAGIHGLTNVLAVELAEAGILSNVVMPGFTLTEANFEEFPQEVRDHVAEMTPTNRLTTPEDVAALVVFLGSEANGHINGEAIRVTGGA